MYAKVFRRKSVMFINIMFLYFPLVRVFITTRFTLLEAYAAICSITEKIAWSRKWGASLVSFLMISINSSPFLSTRSLPRSSYQRDSHLYYHRKDSLRNLTYFIYNFLVLFRFHQGHLDYQRDETLMSRKCC